MLRAGYAKVFVPDAAVVHSHEYTLTEWLRPERVYDPVDLGTAAAILFAWPIAMGPTAPVGAWPLWWAGVIELVTGVLITVGLLTRIAAFFASGKMAFAYFTQHLPHGFSPSLSVFGVIQENEGSVPPCRSW